MSRLDDIRDARIEREYLELRATDRALFDECVQSAEVIMINHYSALGPLTEPERLRLGADIEQRLVSVAVRAKAVRS